KRVADLLSDEIVMLVHRARLHDATKLEEPEASAFARATVRLRDLTYGSPEYDAEKARLGEALAHHYAHNSHHPEHGPDGVAGMDLLDLVEMLCDWKAATERHADGDLGRSLEINAGRFGICPQLAAILRVTARNRGWL